MKKVLLLLMCLSSSCKMMGQIFEREKPSNVTIQHRLCFYGRYELNEEGLYYYKDYIDNVLSPKDYYKLSDGNERFFAYDKKNNRYYFYSNNIIGYYCPTKIVDTKDFTKRIVDNNVPIVTLEDIPKIKSMAREYLDKVYKEKNDSIINKRRIAHEKDSIEAMNRKAREYNEYRNKHNWHELELDNVVTVNCGFCKEKHYERSIYVISLNSDTIYYLHNKPEIEMLGKACSTLHFSEITNKIKQDKNFIKHMEVWRDSIVIHNEFSNAVAEKTNLYRYLLFKEEIIKEAPFGFVENWGWNLNSAYGVEPFFSFYNTSKKTIKYVDFYFSLYNDVGDKCFLKYNKSYTGSVRGVGPVETDRSASWNWDRATHYTSADASEMRIVKIVITYMDKTVKTLTGNAIKLN